MVTQVSFRAGNGGGKLNACSVDGGAGWFSYFFSGVNEISRREFVGGASSVNLHQDKKRDNSTERERIGLLLLWRVVPLALAFGPRPQQGLFHSIAFPSSDI